MYRHYWFIQSYMGVHINVDSYYGDILGAKNYLAEWPNSWCPSFVMFTDDDGKRRRVDPKDFPSL